MSGQSFALVPSLAVAGTPDDVTHVLPTPHQVFRQRYLALRHFKWRAATLAGLFPHAVLEGLDWWRLANNSSSWVAGEKTIQW